MEHLTENGFLIKVASGVDSGWDGASSCSVSHIVTSCCTPMATRSGSFRKWIFSEKTIIRALINEPVNM